MIKKFREMLLKEYQKLDKNQDYVTYLYRNAELAEQYQNNPPMDSWDGWTYYATFRICYEAGIAVLITFATDYFVPELDMDSLPPHFIKDFESCLKELDFENGKTVFKFEIWP